VKPAPPPAARTKDVAIVPGLDPQRVIFVGNAATAVCWYRCALPATFLNADWIGVTGIPNDLRFVTGMVRNQTILPDWNDYDVIVLQQPYGTRWLNFIKRRQATGAKVLYEIDDYVHAIRKLPKGEHSSADAYPVKRLRQMEMCMRMCDGIIASTDYIAQRYRGFNQRLYVCRNGIDTGRYNLTLPEREGMHVGWAGGTGHARAMTRWLPAVSRLMDEHEDTCFVSVGDAYANLIRRQGRTIAVPWTSIETYPAAMTNMDVALAPALSNAFYRGKSDLRWVEAGALGIPAIADPDTYPELEHGVTGFHAKTADEALELLRLLHADPGLRRAVGAAAREHVREKRDMRYLVGQWAEVLLMALN
jgi:glycosyltransferase involved in cell wall biosynthesis